MGDQYNDMRVGFRNVLTGYAGEQREHVVANATLWTCQLARRQLNTPHGIHANARTKQEHNFSTEPTSGMKWSGGRNGAGWHVNPVRPYYYTHASWPYFSYTCSGHTCCSLTTTSNATSPDYVLTSYYLPLLLTRCGPWSILPSSRRSDSVRWLPPLPPPLKTVGGGTIMIRRDSECETSAAAVSLVSVGLHFLLFRCSI